MTDLPYSRRFSGGDADVWNEIIGPVYDAAGLASVFGITAVQLDAMIESKATLKLETADGLAGFPANLFGTTGVPVPHLADVQARLLQNEFMEEWTIAMWLNDRPQAWEGASAVELLTTEWADEVIAQAGEDRRSPLRQRAEQAQQMAIAKPILDRFVELVAELPVIVADETLFVSRETDVPYGVFAMRLGGGPHGMRVGRFRIDGSPEQRAKDLAEVIAAQIAATAND